MGPVPTKDVSLAVLLHLHLSQWEQGRKLIDIAYFEASLTNSNYTFSAKFEGIYFVWGCIILKGTVVPTADDN